MRGPDAPRPARPDADADADGAPLDAAIDGDDARPADPAPTDEAATSPVAGTSAGDEADRVLEPQEPVGSADARQPVDAGELAPLGDDVSALLQRMLDDLSATHVELVRELTPIVDERDATLEAVDTARGEVDLEAVLFGSDRRFPEHIEWLRRVSAEVTRLRRAELESQGALAQLAHLRDTHLARPPAGVAGSTPTPDAASGASPGYDELRLTAVATERGPAPLERVLERFHATRKRRRVGRWLWRLAWLAVIVACVVAWALAGLEAGAWAAGGAAALWLTQELLLNRLRDRRRHERQRATIRSAVHDFYAARLVALLELSLVRSQLDRMRSA